MLQHIAFAPWRIPELKVAGILIFRAEAFDIISKLLPRADAIANQIYVGQTVTGGLIYSALRMTSLDALVHALKTG